MIVGVDADVRRDTQRILGDLGRRKFRVLKHRTRRLRSMPLRSRPRSCHWMNARISIPWEWWFLRWPPAGRSTQLESAIARLEIKIEQRTADLMKWSFVFWLGAVAAIAILAGILN